MNLWGWGKKKWQEWNPWSHVSGQEPDKENGQTYPSTRIEQEGAGVVAIARGDKSWVTPVDKQRRGNEIREAQGIRAQELWREQQQREQDNRERLESENQQRLDTEEREREWVGQEQNSQQSMLRSQSARELLADIRQQRGITDQAREERDRAQQLERQQGEIER